MNSLSSGSEAPDPDFMTSLARGLEVMSCFAVARRPLTTAQPGQLTGLSRSAVRRCLYALAKLGYAEQRGQDYGLRPMVLTLGHAYLASDSLPAIAQPILDRLRDTLHESCSLGVLDGDEVMYVARAEVDRVTSIALRPGRRLPLYCTSMGRVLLAALPFDAQRGYLARTILKPLTAKTETDPEVILHLLRSVSEAGFAIVDQEFELGLRSVAVPVIGRTGIVGAINIGTQSSRVTMAGMRSKILSALLKAAQDLSVHGL